MAEKPEDSKKRRVKNPETFRERASKAAGEVDKPTRKSRVGNLLKAIFHPFKKVFRAVGNLLGRFRIFRLLGKILYPTYIRNSWVELKQVAWPNWKQSRQLTFAVLVFAVIFGVLVALLDFGLDKLFRNVLLK